MFTIPILFLFKKTIRIPVIVGNVIIIGRSVIDTLNRLNLL